MGVKPELPSSESHPKAVLRSRLVKDAVTNWVEQTIDLGGNNRLLNFRPFKRSTLDLATGSKAVRSRLLRGLSVKISALFDNIETLKDVSLRCRTIKARADEYDQERGILTLRVGYGFATWTNTTSGSAPNAPVLLRDAELVRIGRLADDFELQLVGDWEMNPSLVHVLRANYGATTSTDDIVADLDDVTDTQGKLDNSLREIGRRYSDIADIGGFELRSGFVLANFTYTKIAQAIRLEEAEEEISEHALLSAIAGDPKARKDLGSDGTELSMDQIDDITPKNEFLVLDADSSQSMAITAALNGQDMVLIGPPGTGKSQTIANMIASFSAQGKRVLFVAEKRAAIEAVTKRLDQVGLGELVLDIHAGASAKRKVAEELNAALESTRETMAPDLTTSQRNLSRRRNQLNKYVDALHATREPWGISVHQANVRALDLSQSNPKVIAFDDLSLTVIGKETINEALEILEPFVKSGGIRIWKESQNPWREAFTAGRISTTDQVRSLQNSFSRLRSGLTSRLKSNLVIAARECHTDAPTAINDLIHWANNAHELTILLSDAKDSLFEEDLQSLQHHLRFALGNPINRHIAKLVRSSYRNALRITRGHAISDSASDSELAQLVTKAMSLQAGWPSHDDAINPIVPSNLDEIIEQLEEVRLLVSSVAECSPVISLGYTLDELDEQLALINEYSSDLFNLPELVQQEDRLGQLGVSGFIDWCRDSSFDGDEAVAYLEYSWLRAIITEVSISDRTIGGFKSSTHDGALASYRELDRLHISSGAQRVKRRWAENSVSVQNTHPDETAIVRHQARLKRRHMPVRELITNAANVVGALKPCWVMSPLAVAETLPAGRHFDVVLFDEASQILPEDAILSILQADQAVVVGDPKQLPPTGFFRSQSGSTDEDADEGENEDYLDEEILRDAQQFAVTKDLESILDVVQTTLPGPNAARYLEWHYRSEDERLIAFSNWHPDLYSGQLTTFPGAWPGDRIEHELVPSGPHSGPMSSYSPEVDRVVEMVLEHAENRPTESLGVITMGVTHRNRIEELIRLKRRERPDLDVFFAESEVDPFFVKNLEVVQGDERDAIILSIGYSKTQDGRMRYNFGPINQEGGERRLNVAITRARKRVAIVSCFSGPEMDPNRLNNIGPQMLKAYLEYAASGGVELPRESAEKIELNAFEIDVRNALLNTGIRVESQYGASGYLIDFAAMHPSRPSEPVLAIEADGARYHSSQSARDRDRLRQEHLERLGWTFFRIWSTDWFRDKDPVIDLLKEAYEKAVAIRDNPEPIKPMLEPSRSVHITLALDRGERPRIPLRQNIQGIPTSALVNLIKWIKSDGLLRTEDELLQEAVRELGYKRRGPKIVEALTKAIRRAK